MFEFTTLEISAAHRMKHAKHGEDEDMGPSCLSKLVCLKSQNERVVGFHFVGPNAGEVTQVCVVVISMYESSCSCILYVYAYSITSNISSNHHILS